ncbi:hypothetical protein CC2G_004202 [Coprinopsis cinerea AmutBmut pab1-1]|nr:hypothetical protein CC2G_004202 [Coprinopsis cinerea AmutBmut pab1-1]
MPPSYNRPRSEPRARRFRTLTMGRGLVPSPGGPSRPLRPAHTWSGPYPTIDSTPTNNPFYIPPGDTAPSTPVPADIEAFKESFSKLPIFTSGSPSSSRRYTPTPLARRHAVIIQGRPLGAECRSGGQEVFPSQNITDRGGDGNPIDQPTHSSPISIKIESSPTYHEMLLKGIAPVGHRCAPKTYGANPTASNRAGPSRPFSSSAGIRKGDSVDLEARNLVASVGFNPIDELIVQWAREAVEEEGRLEDEDLYLVPKFSRAPSPKKQSRYSLRNRAKVGKRTVVTRRNEEDSVDLRPTFFRKAAFKTFDPAKLPVANIDLLTELCSRTPRGLTLSQFSKLLLQCQDCEHYHYCERLELHKCRARPVQTTEYSSIEYDIGFDFLSYKRRGFSEEQMRDIFLMCTLCDRVFLRKYNRSHVCDSDN